MDLTLVRHAQAGWAASAGSQGNELDPPLTEHGVAQAELLAERAARWKRPTAVFSSPALRAQQTAEPLAAQVGVKAEVLPWLEEVSAPGGAHLDATRAAEQIPARAMQDLRTRTAAGLGALLARYEVQPSGAPGRWTRARDDTRLVLVGHGMALAVALEWLLGIAGVPWAGHRFQFAHAAFAAVRAYDFADDWVFGLVRYNDDGHIPRDLRSY